MTNEVASTDKPAELLSLLGRYEQQHVLDFWSELSADEQKQLAEQVRSIDFAELKELFSGAAHATDWGELANRAQSPPSYRLNAENKFSLAEAIERGEQAIGQGRLGAILVAGGQGTRLGFDHPKGMFPIGPVSNRTLFQMHIDQLLAISQRYNVRVPLYLMTSPATHQPTVDFLEANDRFGLPAEDLQVFCQGTMPAVDAKTGRVLLAEKGRIFASPDGHGGTLAALDRNGCLKDMNDRGIQQLFYFQVDNPLVSICDASLIGYHLLSESELSTQVVAKTDPLEKVGNLVNVDGKTMIIEYSDLPAESAKRTDENGSLALWAGNIAVHVFDVDFLQRMAKTATSLPFHCANKKVPFVDSKGQATTPHQPNAIKFERFIFDLLPTAKNAIVVEVDAQQSFAPLKNASGAAKDTPESTRAAISSKHSHWLTQAGASVAEGITVEVSPRFAFDETEIAAKIDTSKPIVADTYFA